MLIALLLILSLIALSLLAIAPVLVRLLRDHSMDDAAWQSLESFSVSTYYPMRCLLAEEDFSFLVRQPGFDFSLYRKLRRERMLIFRQYMGRLITDFNRLHSATRFLISHSQEDHSELLIRLLKLRFRFSLSVMRAEFSFYSCWCGLSSLAAHAAIARLEEMSSEFSDLVSALQIV